MTPVGIAATRSSARCVVSRSAAPRAVASATASATPSSVPRSGAAALDCASATRCAEARRRRQPATATTASRLARDRVPAHAAVERDEPERRALERRARVRCPSALIAFTRPAVDVGARVAASCAGELDHAARASSAATGSGASASRRNVWSLPAQPTVIASSLVPSRLTSSRPDDERRVERLRAVEPLLLGHGEEELERAVRERRPRRSPAPRATPMPSSAPSVVPSAATQSPSTTTPMRPSRGSYGLSGSRSHTMSRCACRTTDRRGLATRTSREPRRRRCPPSSTARRSPRSDAHARTCSRHRLLRLRRPRDPGQLEEALPHERGLEPGERRAHRRSVSAAPMHEERDPEHARPRRTPPARPRTSRTGR